MASTRKRSGSGSDSELPRPRLPEAELAPAMRMVQHEARAAVRELPRPLREKPAIEDELVSVGYAALVEIVARHDATRGPFVTFARPHVHWAMLRFAYRDETPPHVRLAHLHMHREGRSKPPGLSFDETRADARRKAVEWAKQELADVAAQWAFARLPPDILLEAKQTQERARAAVARIQHEELTPEERWFVDHFYAGGAKVTEIATELCCDVRTVHRMRKRIQALLSERLTERGVESPTWTGDDA